MEADELSTTVTADLDENFSEDSFKRSWQQAINEETVPLSELWEHTDIDLILIEFYKQ
jgi:hypothetical protein